MQSLRLRFFYSIAFMLTFYSIYYFSTRDTNSPELVGMLNEVECFNEQEDDNHAKRNRALVNFEDYALYFICLSKDTTEKKQLLKCETEGMSQPICGKEAVLYQHYSLTKDGRTIDISNYDEGVPDLESAVSFLFSQGGLNSTGNVKANKTQFHFGKKDLRYSDKFEFKEDFICESKSNILNSAMCHAVLSYNSLDIRVSIHLLGEEGTEFREYDAKKNIQHWLRLLNDIVQPVVVE